MLTKYKNYNLFTANYSPLYCAHKRSLIALGQQLKAVILKIWWTDHSHQHLVFLLKMYRIKGGSQGFTFSTPLNKKPLV